MATPPNASTPNKLRGHSLFNQQAHIHAHDSDISSSQKTTTTSKPPTLTKVVSTPIVTHTYQTHTPVIMHRRSPSSISESYAHTDDDNIQLLSIHSRPESDYLQRLPPRVPKKPVLFTQSAQPTKPVLFTQSVQPTKPVPVPQLLETDFPFYENCDTRTEPEPSTPNDLTSTAVIDKAFQYLETHDDDDDVIHQENSYEQEYDSDSFDDENDEIPSSIPNLKYDSGIQTLPLTEQDNKSNENDNSREKLSDHQPLMAHLSQTTASEEYDSEFDDEEDSLPDDDEQLTRKDSNHEEEEDDDDEEQQNQILLRQQQILWGIVQEWLRKEEIYIEQIHKMEEQLNYITLPNNLQTILHSLLSQHKKVFRQIQGLYRLSHQPANITEPLTDSVEALMQTLPIYNSYIEFNLTSIRKSLEKRTNANGSSVDDLLSIPAKQFLQILSQVQDLYQTAQAFESGDVASITKLYNHAQRCRLYGSRQDENINKVVLKNEDVATTSERGNRDRCRLILYPDAIVCCNLKTKLLTSPKYALLWFIPINDLQWTIPQTNSEDNHDTGDELKINLKSYYKELERAPKSNTFTPTRLTKTIRKQQDEFQLAQSKLQLILTNTSRSSSPLILLFSSAYQRQDWIDLIDKTKQDLLQRRSTVPPQSNNSQQRLNDSVIQKRLDLIKPNLYETNPNELSSTSQTMTPIKSYSGTLSITIHSIQGSALFHSGRGYQTLPTISSSQQQLQKNYHFYVAVEVDSYNTFYPYAQTSKQLIQQNETVEFKGEVFQVELEHSLAFRLLIYRVDASAGSNNNSSTLQRSTCIGKFHRDIEPALRDCQHSSSGVIYIESQSGDLKLKISLKYQRRDGTFKRQPSKRSQAVFGKSIEKLFVIPNGLIDGIPRIIVKCVEIVERDGLTETGIYRVCCVASDLQKLRHEFDKNMHRAEDVLTQKNVHVAANLLKLFFRELPEPLFTSTLYKQFLHAIQLTDIDNQRIMLVKTFELLNSDNRKICFYLFDHLIRVSQYSNINKMHLDNLAVVFGPTLMRPAKLISTPTYSNNANQRLSNPNSQPIQTDLDQMSSELQGSMYQCQVVLACLKLRRDGILK